MSSRPPAAPPANRSDKGPGDEHRAPKDTAPRQSPGNTDSQGQQGNVKQNTTNQGYQQDR